MARIDLLLERANIDMTPGLFLLCSVGAAGVTYVLCSLLGQPTAVVLSLFPCRISVSIRLRAICNLEKVAQVSRAVPDGLDMISQSLQAGLGLTQSMVFVAREVPDPLGTEFSVFIEEVNLGCRSSMR